MSGIPFGLNADLLRYSGMTPCHFRGFAHASANRWQADFNDAKNGGTPPPGPFDPLDVWKLWDDFAIQDAEMMGWWDKENPVTVVTEDDATAASTTNVVATTYVKAGGGGALIALASFGATQPINVTLSIDWKALGIPGDAGEGWHLRAPVLVPMQPTASIWKVDGQIEIPGPVKGSPTSREGWLLLLEKQASL